MTAPTIHARLHIANVATIEPYAESVHYGHEGEDEETVLTLSTDDTQVTFRDTPGNLRGFLEAALRAVEEPEHVPF